VDILVSRPGDATHKAYVQCKAWRVYDVGVKPVRELFGVMAADHVPEGYFVTSGEFTTEAIEFARGRPLTLIDGSRLIGEINSLPEESRRQILQEILSGDYTTPTCPRCDVKMIERPGPKGPFWGCYNYPCCRQTLNIRQERVQSSPWAS
jgi:restriction system protein